jgi:pilus assembly protein CpaE
MSVTLLVASSDEQFREMVRDNLMNMAGAKIAAEYPEVSANLYIRVLQDLERHPEAALVIDLSADPEVALKALEKVKQAAPDLYAVASNFTADGDSVIAAVRSGASDFLSQPLRRVEFREAMSRLERAPRRSATAAASRLGKLYSFVGVKGGVGATTLAVNFAGILAQRKQQTVLIDLDWAVNDVIMQLGASPQYTLVEVGDNLSRMDQALFEGFVTRDPLGFFLVSPPETMDQRHFFTESMFREFSTFLVEKYESIVINAGRDLSDEVTMAALHSSSLVFLVLTQQFPAIRAAQRAIAHLMRGGFTQDQIKLVVNHYQKKPPANHATIDQIQQTLNQPVFYGIPSSPAMLAAVSKARPLVADRQSAPDVDKALRSFVDKVGGRTPVAQSA